MAKTNSDGDGPKNSPRVERYLAVGKALHGQSRRAYSWYTTHSEDQRAVRLVWRDGDVLALATRYGPDGAPQVLFANGADGIEALLNLAALMGDDGNWKPDKPKS